MIYSLAHRWCLVHVPRTGCTALTAALAQAFPDAAVDSYSLKHARASQLRTIVPMWRSMRRFYVLRDPVQIVASYWHHCRRYVAEYAPELDMVCSVWWYRHAHEIAALSLEQFARARLHELADEGGFRRTYGGCGAVPLPFGEHVSLVEEIVGRPLAIQEATPRRHEVSAEAEAAIRAWCWGD